LIPTLGTSTYVIMASESLKYSKTEEFTLLENETNFLNISMNLHPINISGFVKLDDDPLKGITVNFIPDVSVDDPENNTAELPDLQPISNEIGYYSVELTPGDYNILVEEMKGDTLVYSFTDNIKLTLGKGSKILDILVNKNSSSVSGITAYQGTIKGDILIDFQPDGSIENNTAEEPLDPISNSTTGFYSVELSPGFYNISINRRIYEEDKNVTYEYSKTHWEITNNQDRILDIELILAKEEE
jgi:hypothetical protein